jgi:hypothetical protein
MTRPVVLAGLAALFAGVGIGHAQSAGHAVTTDSSVATFARDVAPIMFAKCATCHRPGEVAPIRSCPTATRGPGRAPFAGR